jgi:hypothetical protein
MYSACTTIFIISIIEAESSKAKNRNNKDSCVRRSTYLILF